MPYGVNRQILFASHPHGEPTPENFRFLESTIPEAGPGEVVLRNRYLSLDPYMRGRMSTAKSYAKGFEIGQPLGGGTVSVVVASNNPAFAQGDLVVAMGGWQDYTLSDGNGLLRVDPTIAPITTALGVLGMPGMTAYTGLTNIGEPKDGETLVVAAAAGPVGATVGQIAKIKGCRVVGIAGGEQALLSDRRTRLRCRTRPPLAGSARRARRSLPDGHRRLFRECRRRRVGCGDAAAE